MSDLRLVRHGAPALGALARAVDDAKAGDPLAPVTVAAPTVYAGLALRRSLARGDGRDRPGLVNVRFLPLARVAELLGAPVLAARGHRPLTGPLRAEAVRAALAEQRGALSAVASHPATVRALARTFTDLRRAGPAARARLARRGPRPEHVVRCFDAFCRHTEGFADDEDLAAAAVGAVDAGGPAVDGLGGLVVHLPRALSPAELTLVGAFARRGRARAVLGLVGEPDADRPAVELAERLATVLGAAAVEPAAPSPARVSVLEAPDPDDEVREVVRSIVARLDRVDLPLHRVAILYRTADPYARVVHEQLRAAGIPAHGPATGRLAETVAGRALLGLLAVPAGGYRRDAVMDWLASAPILEVPGTAPVPAHRWDVLSRRAGVVGGIEQWRDRLAGYGDHLRRRAERAADDPEADGALDVEADLDHLDRLGAFVDGLAGALEPPDPPTWPALARWSAGLLDRYLGGEGARERWPEHELRASREVRRRVEALGDLGELAGPGRAADVDELRQALQAGLDVPWGHAGRFGTGVFVGSLRDAYGLDPDVVYVLGMVEGAFPPRGREDPLLPDDDRAVGGLPLAGTRRAEERRDHLAAVGGAREQVLCWSRADLRSQRERLPARWLLAAAAGLAGVDHLGARELSTRPGPWHRVVPSFEAGLLGAEAPASPLDLDLSDLRRWQQAGRPLRTHPRVRAVPALGDGLEALAARRSSGLGPHDGLVGPLDGLLPDLARTLSATSLERYAACPRRYLLEQVLRVHDVERPEDVETISALDRGSLVHEVLEVFLRSVPARRRPDAPWTPAERDRLLELAERCFDDAVARGLTGRPLLWAMERRRLRRVLRDFADADEDHRSARGVVTDPDALELVFGDDAGEPVSVTLPGGTTVAFRGRIDRIDVAPDGSRLVVLDYKTGRDQRYTDLEDDPVVRGTMLQLPIYALAATRRAPEAAVEARYWFLETGRQLGYAVDDTVMGRFLAVLEAIFGGIAAGVFPANPGAETRDSWANCRTCPYDRLCPPDRDVAWERKRHAPTCARYLALAEPGAAPPGEGP